MHTPRSSLSFRIASSAATVVIAAAMTVACGSSSSNSSSNSAPPANPGGSSNPGSGGSSASPGGSSSGSGGAGSGSSSGGGGTPSPSAAHARFLYSSTSAGIDTATIDSASNLTRGSSIPLETNGAASSMAADPMGRFFYVVSVSAAFRGNQSGGNGISEYTIDQGNGSLSPIKGAPILFADADRDLTNIVVDANGKFAYITDNNSAAGRNGIFSYSIDQSSGRLSPVSGSPFGTSAGPLLAVTPNGKDLLNAGNGQIVAYTLNNGQPTPTGAPLSGGGNFGAASPSPLSGQLLPRSDSAFVYLLDKSASAVDVYAVGANGALTTVAGSPFKVGISGSGDNMALTPDGRFLYVETFDSSTGRSSLSGYTVNTSTGAVGSALPGSPFISNDANALAVVLVDFSGKFLFANTSAGVTTYNIGSDGSLTKSSVSSTSGAVEQDFALVH